MATKVFVNSDNTATLRCPHCQKTRVADVSKYIKPDASSLLKVRCPCGQSFAVSLEKRKNFRKETCLEGIFNYPADYSETSRPEIQGRIQVLDISRTGMRIQLFAKPKFKVGDLINVQFRLDNNQQSLVDRNVYVKNIKGLTLGVEYATRMTMDSVLGFYLFN